MKPDHCFLLGGQQQNSPQISVTIELGDCVYNFQMLPHTEGAQVWNAGVQKYRIFFTEEFREKEKL